MIELAAPAPERPATRERGSDAKLRQILRGARTVFLRDGFDGASMNDIAREAGVSKGTLYVYFPSKEGLFAAYVTDDRRRQAEQIVPYGSSETLEANLMTIAVNFMREMFTPSHIAQIRTVVAAAAKFPEIGHAFYEAGPAYGQHRVAAVLEAHAADGHLEIDDFQAAAITFANLVQGDLLKRALFRSEVFPAGRIEQTVREGVAMFLRLYARPDPRA